MVEYNPLRTLPTEADLPETDNQPVDNELQILIPNLLRAILALHWGDRFDWFLGVNLGVYYDPNKPAIGPDGFLIREELLEKLRQRGIHPDDL